MRIDGAQGQIGRGWRKYFYDGECDPPEWHPHPFRRFKPIGRFLAAFVGSTVPVGVILITTGVTKKLDEGSLLIGWTFWVTFAICGVVWVGSVGMIAATEQKRMWQYFVAGIHPPAWAVLVIQMIQSYN